MRHGRDHRRRGTAVVLFTVFVAILSSGATAEAQPAPTPSAVALQVSFDPSDKPTTAVPGELAHAEFRVTNPADSTIGVEVRPATPVPGNDGSLAFDEGVDPRFGDAVSWSPSQFAVDPKSTTTVAVDVDVPNTLAPGVYLLGFLVKPRVSGPGLVVVNQVGALVTLKVPGATREHLSARFHELGRKLPVLGHVQLATRGNATLRVLDDGPSSLFSYHEVTGDVGWAGIGRVVFDGHTENLPDNLRRKTRLYMPGLWVDDPITWRVSPFGFGQTRLTANVSYRADMSTVRAYTTQSSVWVVSPWCLLLVVLWETLMLVAVSERARRSRATSGSPSRARRATRTVSLVVVSLFAAVTAAVSDPNVFAGLCVVGMLAAAAALARPGGRVEPPKARRRIRVVALGLGAVAALAGSAAVASITLGSPATIAAGVFAAAGTWVVLLRGLLYWSQRPRAARGGTDAVGVEAKAA